MESYSHRQRGYYDLRATPGLQAPNGYQSRRPGPDGRKWPNGISNGLNGFKDYRGNAQWYGHDDRWPQERAVRTPYTAYPNYHHSRQPNQELLHGHSGRQPWILSDGRLSNYPYRRPHSRPHIQFRPWPRSAKYRRSDFQPSDSHQDASLGGPPYLETWLFEPNAVPIYQPYEAYGGFGAQSGHEQQPSHYDSEQHLDHWPWVWPGNHPSKRRFDQSTPSPFQRAHSNFYGNPHLAHETPADTARGKNHRHHEKRAKNGRPEDHGNFPDPCATSDAKPKDGLLNSQYVHIHKACAI